MRAAIALLIASALAAVLVIMIRAARPPPGDAAPGDAAPGDAAPGDAAPGDAAPKLEDLAMKRADLIQELRDQGITDAAVLDAVARVPRERFVPPELTSDAYANHPLPIGHEQTISQPYIVAFMTQAARLGPGANVLEVGTGSGYQAAVLAEVLGLRGASESPARLCSIEIIEPLGRNAATLLSDLGYRVDVRIGDGYRGWPERAPFDAILVTAAPSRVPQPLLDQLAVGGRMVIPVGEGVQDLRVITRGAAGLTTENVLAVRFVPMTGEAQADAR